MTSLLLTTFVFVVLCCLTERQEPKQSPAFVPATSDDIGYTVETTFNFESWLITLVESDDPWEQSLIPATVSTVEANVTVDAIESLPKQPLLLAPATSDVETAKVIAEVKTIVDTQATESIASLSKKELMSRIRSKGYHVANLAKMSKAEVFNRYTEMLELEAVGLRR